MKRIYKVNKKAMNQVKEQQAQYKKQLVVGIYNIIRTEINVTIEVSLNYN